jgi:hypothetical protein
MTWYSNVFKTIKITFQLYGINTVFFVDLGSTPMLGLGFGGSNGGNNFIIVYNCFKANIILISFTEYE